MSDRERSLSRTRNGSREPGSKQVVMTRGHSRSRSRTPPPPKTSSRKYRSPSRSQSGSPRRQSYRRYTRSRSYSPRVSYRRSRSHSPMSQRRRHMGDKQAYRDNGKTRSGASHSRLNYKRTRSRSRSYRRYSRSRSRSYSYRRSRSTSPMSSRRRHTGDRDKKSKIPYMAPSALEQENPTPSRCLGIFGLSLYTTEQQINHIFSKYGPVEKTQVVIDAKTGRSRGFCFIYFESQEDAKVAKNECSGMEIDGRRIRVDFSITQRAHTPTPGIYMGKPTSRDRDNGYERRGGRGDRDDWYSRGGGGGYRDRERERDYDHRGYRGYRHRSPSPHYRRSRRYERERSYSPRRY